MRQWQVPRSQLFPSQVSQLQKEGHSNTFEILLQASNMSHMFSYQMVMVMHISIWYDISLIQNIQLVPEQQPDQWIQDDRQLLS